jgi:hypothetical protein
MCKSIKLDVFGKHVLSMRTDKGWSIFYLSDDGKRRPARDIFVPEFVSESEIVTYLADLCHEWATEKNHSVRRLK